ncbi:MAG: SH3 domain-containing protein [Chloroflexota bacterium]
MYKTNNLYQNDEKWKSVALGNQAKETIGSWGCLLTSITMMLNGAGYNETPDTVNEKLKRGGGYDGALLIPSVVPYLYPNVTYRTYEPCENRPAPIGQIDATLAAGKPVIVCVDWNPKESGVQTHWVLLKERKGSSYSMYDPYRYRGDGPDKELILTDRYKFQGTTPEEAIHAVIWFDLVGQAAKPPEKPKVPVPAEKFTVYVVEDDLAFRAEPSAGGYLLRRFIAGTALISLEAKSTTQAKIGQQGQWLQVQDPKGDQGYVAAWYVAVAEKPAPSPAPVTPPAPVKVPAGAMVVLPMQADLALRSQALVAPETLLKRLPETEQLIVIEPAAQAVQKVGVVGQWLQVKDSSGQTGYVAAWYVKLPPGATPAPVTPTQPEPVKPPVTGGGAGKVQTTTEDVALRSQPTVSDATLIRRLPLGAELTIAETNGQSKVGVNNQWLKVKDPQGTEGYVAAWYVVLAGNPNPPPKTTPPPDSGPLVVRTTTEDVALRSQPVVSDTTLVRRLALDTRLTVLEAGAESKIGVVNQWLKVKDPQGNEGYVAAWYVTR